MLQRTSFLILLFCLFTSGIYGQQRQDQRRGSAYQALLMRTDRPHAYFDHISFPASDGSSQFAFLFRLDYDSVPFMKTNSDIETPTPNTQYYGPAEIGLDVYEGQASRSRRSSDTARSIFRESWQDTLWADTYERTKSRTDYAQGLICTNLDAGQYHYEVQLPQTNMPAASGNRSSRNSNRDISTPRRNVTVASAGETDQPDFILLKSFQPGETIFSGTFLNYGDNVLYGQDYGVLVRIPSNAESPPLSLNLYRLTGGANADAEELRHSLEISAENKVRLSDVRLTNSNNEIGFDANVSDDGTMYAYAEIPNNNFENSTYKLTLENSDADEVLGEERIRSQWLDMPVSLYNLDVAIDMLRFIVSDEKLDELNSGSDTDRERKFREFWKQRDPTQDTEFNELMTEYYKRIDYSYNEFSSLQVPGFQTDQGKTYILYGPPDEVERRLPTNAPTREIWQYPNKTLIFEATTGFGDFKLISEQQS